MYPRVRRVDRAPGGPRRERSTLPATASLAQRSALLSGGLRARGLPLRHKKCTPCLAYAGNAPSAPSRSTRRSSSSALGRQGCTGSALFWVLWRKSATSTEEAEGSETSEARLRGGGAKLLEVQLQRTERAPGRHHTGEMAIAVRWASNPSPNPNQYGNHAGARPDELLHDKLLHDLAAISRHLHPCI